MTIVFDASVVVAGVAADGALSAWAIDTMEREALVAAAHLPVEVTHALRRQERLGRLAPAVAVLAHADAMSLGIELIGFEPFAERVWELRHAVSPYDAWYVAIAELLDRPLATLDRRLAAADGPRCRFLTPPPEA